MYGLARFARRGKPHGAPTFPGASRNPGGHAVRFTARWPAGQLPEEGACTGHQTGFYKPGLIASTRPSIFQRSFLLRLHAVMTQIMYTHCDDCVYWRFKRIFL